MVRWHIENCPSTQLTEEKNMRNIGHARKDSRTFVPLIFTRAEKGKKQEHKVSTKESPKYWQRLSSR